MSLNRDAVRGLAFVALARPFAGASSASGSTSVT